MDAILNSFKSTYNFIFKALFIVVVSMIVFILFKDVGQNSVVMNDYSVPNSFKDKGYTGQEISRLVADEIKLISIEANKFHQQKLNHLFDPNITEVKIPDLALPGTGFSLQTIRSLIDAAFEFPVIKVGGSVTSSSEKINITARVSGHPSKTFSDSNERLPALIKKAAIYTLQVMEPRTLIIYFQGIEDYQSLKSLYETIKKSNPNDITNLALIDSILSFNNPEDGESVFEQHDNSIKYIQKALKKRVECPSPRCEGGGHRLDLRCAVPDRSGRNVRKRPLRSEINSRS